MLLDAVLKSLSCSSYVPTVTVALMLIDDGTLLNGRLNIFPTWRQHFSGDKYRSYGHGSIAIFNNDSGVLL